ncbi:hypothetical protein GCM10011321_03790 [Youhaiella tibetensis]|nr:hypothetical protein GCM10011321_03790 [Youhaiella tibetensis]
MSLADDGGDLLEGRRERGRLAPDKGKQAAGAWGGEGADGDARVNGLLAQRDFGQQRDALAVGHELDDGRERGGRERARGRIGFERTGGDGLVAQAVALIEQQDALGREAGERHRALGRFVARRGEHEGIGEERGDGQPRAARRRFAGDERQVELAFGQGLEQRFGATFAGAENEVRKLRLEGREYVGQQIGRDGGDKSEPNRPGGLAGMALGEGHQVVGGLEHLAGAFDEFGPERGRAHGPALAVEKGGAAELLDELDLLGKRRLGDAAAFGGTPEMAGFGKDQSIAHLLEGEAHDKFILS